MNAKTGNKSRGTMVNTKGLPVILLIIDPQVDFHEQGSLPIMGSNADSDRIAAMIRNNLDRIDEIYVTLDSHHVNHIAHQSFWEWGGLKGKDPKHDPRCDIFIDGEEKDDSFKGSSKGIATATAVSGSSGGGGDVTVDASAAGGKDQKIRPKVFSTLSSDDIMDGTWVPVDRSLRDYCIMYTQLLEKKGKFTLTIWPNHCLIGTTGHSVVSNIGEALQEWTSRKMKIVNFVHKGMNCLTEMYSAIEAEVPVSTDPSTIRNMDLLRKWRNPKRLIVCGQALSHCVCWTVYDIIADWKISKTYMNCMTILEDGSSPVNMGDYPEKSKLFLKDLSERGVKITTCAHAFDNL